MAETQIHIAADDRPMFGPRPSSARWVAAAAAAAVVIAIAGGAYYLWQRQPASTAVPVVPSPSTRLT